MFFTENLIGNKLPVSELSKYVGCSIWYLLNTSNSLRRGVIQSVTRTELQIEGDWIPLTLLRQVTLVKEGDLTQYFGEK